MTVSARVEADNYKPRQAHNLEIPGSTPGGATNSRPRGIWRRAGLCSECGGETGGRFAACLACRRSRAEARKELREKAASRGLCGRCGTRPAAPGRRTCLDCLLARDFQRGILNANDPPARIQERQALRRARLSFDSNGGTRLLEIVAWRFNARVEELVAADRHPRVVYPRQVAMYLLQQEARLSLPRIGKMLGAKHHTTVLYGVRRIAALARGDGEAGGVTRRHLEQIISAWKAEARMA